MYDSKTIIEFIPRVPHFDLPDQYKWADIFFFATIEDGYPAVLGQAHSMGLPILATPNSSAPDILRDGFDGKLIPAGEYLKFLRQLDEWESDRSQLAVIAENGLKRTHVRDWQAVAERFEEIVDEELSRH
jgi:glycosyltransferase involved in cell wall biosynthesis